MNGTPLLRIEDLRVSFRTAHGPVLPLNGVSLSLHDDEVLAVVGESGSGKTLTGLSVLGLEPPDAMVTGRVWFRDEELRAAPPLTVGRQVAEVVRRHQGLSWTDARSRALELFDLVRLPSAARHLRSYPHQLSGGMRQRGLIAIAAACDPAVPI